MTWLSSKKSMLLLFVCGLLLSACTVKINDSEFCADIGSLGATCFQLLSDHRRDISKAQWDKLRFGQICETPDVFANLKSAIESLCQNTNNCTYEQKEQVAQFFTKVESIKKKAKK